MTKSAQQIAAITTLTAQLNDDVAMLTADLAKFDGVILGQGHIVMMSDAFCLKFDINGLNGQVTNPKQCRAISATMFTRSDAERIAAEAKDGNGAHGKALHVRDAIKLQIQNLQTVLSDIAKL